MKKHPVDRLFSDKLKDFEMKPSDNTWERLQVSPGKKGVRKIFVYWSAAAMVLMAFGGYYWIQQNERTSGAALAVTDQQKESRPSIVSSELPSDSRPILIEDNAGQEAGKPVRDQSAANPDVINRPDVSGTEATGLAFRAGKASGPASISNETTSTFINAAAGKDTSGLVNREVIIPQIAGKMSYELPETDVSLTKVVSIEKVNQENISSRVIVAVLQEDIQPDALPEGEGKDEKKSKRLKQIFTQLKKAKKGEEVDWNEVGFNPKSILAKVDFTNNDYEE